MESSHEIIIDTDRSKGFQKIKGNGFMQSGSKSPLYKQGSKFGYGQDGETT
jgi:hypothetical protein